MKRAWERSVLSVLWWDGQPPMPGDAVETSTGRRYLILRLRFGRAPTGSGKLGPLRALETVVLPKGEPVDGKIHQWRWAPRTRKSRRSTWGRMRT